MVGFIANHFNLAAINYIEWKPTCITIMLKII